MEDLENCTLESKATNLEKEGAKIAEIISSNPAYRILQKCMWNSKS